MPTLAEVNRTFPESVQAFEEARAMGRWKGDDYWDWLGVTIERNPNSEWARYASFGQVPEGRADPVGDEMAAAASEKSYEQELFDQVNRDYIQPDIAQDAERRTLANELTQQATTDYQAARDLASQSIGPSFNADQYFAQNPDVAEAYARQVAQGGTETTAMTGEPIPLTSEQRRENMAAISAGQPQPNTQQYAPVVTKTPVMSPQEFAQQHYETVGKTEGRQGGEYTSRLQREYANTAATQDQISDSAATSATERRAALETQIAAMRQSQDVNQQERANALQLQLNQLNANIDTRSAGQQAVLGEEIGARRQSLNVAQQGRASALQNQLGQLNTNVDERAAGELQALQSEIEAMRGSLDVSQQQKADALQQQIAQLGGSIDTYDAAQKAALVDEITKLTAAQLPVSQARVAAAENLVSSINLGLEQTRDQFASDQAAQGFIGGSSAQQGNLARAVIGARQNAAQTRSQADLSNADDMRTIGSRDATEGRTIANSTATNRFGLSNYGANTGYTDNLYGAGERRRLSDELAGRTGTVENARLTDRYNIGTYGANTGYSDNLLGVTEGRSLSDELATRMGGLKNERLTDRYNTGLYGANTAYGDSTTGSGERRALSDALASGQGGISTQLTAEQQAARDQGAARNASYFDQDYTRQLGTALTLPSLTTNYTAGINALDQYKNAGLDRSLQTLNWWAGGGQAPSNQTAQYQAYVDQTGANIAGLGTGLLGAAVNVGNSQNWWQTPKTTTVTPPANNSAALNDVTNWGAVA